MVLGYLTLVCLVHMSIHYFPRNVEKYVLSSEHKAASESLASLQAES